MLIQVIGCDASGKSTFIEALSKELNYPVLKGSSFQQSQCSQDELYEKFDKLMDLENTILDRSFYCNLVYAPLYKDYAMISDEQFEKLESKIEGKSLTIYLYADVETLTERLNKRGDDYVKAERIPEILKGYADVLVKSKLNFAHFDTNDIGVAEMVELTKRIIKRIESEEGE